MNLHDLLGRYGADAVAGSRSRLSSVEVQDALDARVRRGRRRRAVGGGIGAVAGISLVAVGVWAVAPGLGAAVDPARPDAAASAGPYRYAVDDAGDAPVQEPEIFLRGDAAVMCGDEVSLTPGVTVHDPEAFERGIFHAAELVTLADVTDRPPPATPEPLDPDNPDGPWTGWDPAEPVWDGWSGGLMTSQATHALLLDGDVVVGHIDGSSGGGSGESHVEGTSGSPIPRVGYCEPSELSWDQLTDLERGDPMDTLLVTQFWGAGEPGDRALLATIVVDPREPANSSSSPMDNQPEWDEPADDFPADPVPDGPAGLRLPEGDTYQAFVVPGPEESCAPFADQLAEGQPGLHNIQYEIELAGVADSLTGELWRDEPILTVPSADSPWYTGLQAWIVADEVGGIEDPPLQWHGDDLSADFVGSYPMRDGECAFTEPVPVPEGSVFLIIHGVDMAAIEASGLMVEWVDPSDLYTWIYLGEAN